MADDSVSISKYLESEYGMKFRGITDDGKIDVLVTPGEDQKALVDAGKATVDSMIPKRVSLDPKKVEAEMRATFEIPPEVPAVLNKESHPVDDSPLGFVDRYKYSVGTTKADRAKLLSEKYGPENVKFEPEEGKFLVKANNVWHNADATGLFGWVGENQDVTVGAIAGGEAGLKLGLATAPVTGPFAPAVAFGTSIVGAGIGAAVARLGTIAEAKARGFRTEQDAEDVKRELYNEGMNAMAGQAIGLSVLPVLKAGGGVANVFGQNLRTVSKKILSPEARTWFATKLMTPLQKGGTIDNIVMVNNPVKGQQYMARIENARMKDPTGSNPVAEEGVIKLQEGVETAKTNMNSKFDQSMKAIKYVTDDLDVETVAPDELMNLFNNVDGQMREMGLIDEAGEALSVSEARLQALGDPTTINRMHVVYTKLRNLIKGPAPKTYKMNVSNPESGSSPEVPFKGMETKGEIRDVLQAQQRKFDADQAYGWNEKTGFTAEKPGSVDGARQTRRLSEGQAQFGPTGGKPGSTTVEVTPAETLDLKTMKTKSNRQRVTFNDLITLQRGIDDIATKAKAYKGQPFEITPEGGVRIAGIRSGVHKVALTALQRRDVRAAKWFDKTNKEFSESRKWFDDSAAELRDGRIDQTLDKMLDDPSRGIIKRDLMKKVFDDNGVDGKALLEDLFLRRGATNTVDFLGGSGAGGVQASALKRGVNKLVLKGAAKGGDVQRRALKSTTDDLVKGANPENFGGKAKELKRGKIQGQMRGVNEGSSLPVGKENFKSKIPLTKESLAEARSRGMLVQWIQQQTPDTVKNLINSPRAMNALSQIMYQAQTAEISITDALVQQAMESSMPTPTPMVPQEEKKAK